MARLAWYDQAATSLVFANGVVRAVGPDELTQFQSICSASRIHPFCVDPAASTEWVTWLLEHGVFDLAVAP
jgi:hypothetical protein